MKPLSREAAATFAQHEIQQKRIERIKAVRNAEKQYAKEQRVQFVSLQKLAQRQTYNDMEQKWEINKENQLKKLTNHYNNLQSCIGAGHGLANTNTNLLNKMAIENQKKITQQNITNQERARNAMSKLQQKMVNEQNKKDERAQWRNNAIQMAQIYRQKLQNHLEHQFFNLPQGLSPQNPLYDGNKNMQYTVVTSQTHNDLTFNPHPKLLLKQIENERIPKTYNLREYLPSKLLYKLNKKYDKKRKKNKRRRKKEQKLKKAGIKLKSDGNEMLSIIPEMLSIIPENNTLSENAENTMYHSIPSHIQNQTLIKEQLINNININN
eukprot:42095_1